MTQNELIKALEHYKIDSGKTSVDIADALGITRATLWAKVNGETPITITQAKTLADMMGLTLEDFYELVPKSPQSE